MVPEADSPQFRLGLRVEDVPAAVAFYRGLGFEEVGSVPDARGRPVMAILAGNGVQLVVDAVAGMPFPDRERERLTKAGPRGLGVALGLSVADLEATYDYCREAGCPITCEPMDEAWGERVFECIDPFGYQWELSQPLEGTQPADPLSAVRERWFGESTL
jgi:uncharacterized glyoxalase superfamily protein PhnB